MAEKKPLVYESNGFTRDADDDDTLVLPVETKIGKATIRAVGLTNPREVALPDKSGTAAMLDDIADAVNSHKEDPDPHTQYRVDSTTDTEAKSIKSPVHWLCTTDFNTNLAAFDSVGGVPRLNSLASVFRFDRNGTEHGRWLSSGRLLWGMTTEDGSGAALQINDISSKAFRFGPQFSYFANSLQLSSVAIGQRFKIGEFTAAATGDDIVILGCFIANAALSSGRTEYQVNVRIGASVNLKTANLNVKSCGAGAYPQITIELWHNAATGRCVLVGATSASITSAHSRVVCGFRHTSSARWSHSTETSLSPFDTTGLSQITFTAVEVSAYTGRHLFGTLTDDGTNPLQATQIGIKNAATLNEHAIRLIDFLSRSRWQAKTAAYTAVHTDEILADTSVAGFTITLPASPTTGDWVEILDEKGTFAPVGKNLTVSGNGKNIKGAASLVMNVNDQRLKYVYNGTEWRTC